MSDDTIQPIRPGIVITEAVSAERPRFATAPHSRIIDIIHSPDFDRMTVAEVLGVLELLKHDVLVRNV